MPPDTEWWNATQFNSTFYVIEIHEETMKRASIIEGMVLFVISLTGIVQGIKLNSIKDPQGLALLMGPGTYILVLSFILLITAIVHVWVSYLRDRKTVTTEKTRIHISRKLILMIAVFALYAYLIDIIGYIIPTTLFFLAEFRLSGVTSWKVNTVLTACIVTSFYFIFIKYCEMVFPRGIF